jgi:hypothetical protein
VLRRSCPSGIVSTTSHTIFCRFGVVPGRFFQKFVPSDKQEESRNETEYIKSIKKSHGVYVGNAPYFPLCSPARNVFTFSPIKAESAVSGGMAPTAWPMIEADDAIPV